MKLFSKGAIVLSSGVVVNGVVIYYCTTASNYYVSAFGTLMGFMAWVFIISGTSSLHEVYKDKRARKGVPMVPPEVKG
ncbi:MAG: hypothetical protein WC822_06570 [Candidatus Paceibacterota bacterium]|jgi:hypothetical protein